MDTKLTHEPSPLDCIRRVLRRVHRRDPEAAARLIDRQFETSDRIGSAYSLLTEAQRARRQPSGFEQALLRDAASTLTSLDLRKLRLPFWWKYGTPAIMAAVLVTGGGAYAAYGKVTDRPAVPVSLSSHHSVEVQALRGVARELGEAAEAAKVGDVAKLGEDLISAGDYLDMLARKLGSADLQAIAAQIKMAGAEAKKGDIAAAGKDLAEAGNKLANVTPGDIGLAEVGDAFAEAGRLLAMQANQADAAKLKELGIGLANDLLEAREVIMNAASKLEWYEDEETLQQLASSPSNTPQELYDKMAKLGEVLKDMNSHLVSQSLPLMERNIPWQDLANLEKMTSGWDDTWPYYVPAAKVGKDLTKSPNAADPALSPEDAKTLYKALVEASKSIASASQKMELMRVKSNPEDLAGIAKDLQSAEMALKETTKLARAIAANYITSIKLNVPNQYEDATMPTAKSIGPAWIYQQQEPNMGVSDLWKMRYVSSYYGSLGIAGDQLGSAGEMLGSAYSMWTNGNDIKAMQEMKLGEEQLIGASRQMAMTLSNYDELRELQTRANTVESYSQTVKKMEQLLPGLEKATTAQGALNALSGEMQALAQPFATTPMYKPDVYYLLDQAGNKLGLAAKQTGDRQKAMIAEAAQDISEAAKGLFGTQEINLREFGQYLEDIASQLNETTANTGGQFFLGPIRKVALDLRGLQELLGVQVKWQGLAGQEAASQLDRTLVTGTVLLRPVTGDEKSPSPNLMASYYIEAPFSAKTPKLKYTGELLAIPTLDPKVVQTLSTPSQADISPERLPSTGGDVVSRYFLSLAKDGTTVKNWVKKEVPVKPGQPHVAVPPLPPDMPPRQPPSTGGGLNCPAVKGK